MPDWTTAQQNAIDARNSNILVSAAAGSGKTAVLVQRVIDIIMDEKLDAGLDKLLIVTFTNAAAAEMKSRISTALFKIMKKEPNNTRAASQLSLLPSAKISTIDTFCINLAREYFFKLDIAQDFKILDDSQKLIVEQSAIDEVIENHYQKGSNEFKGLIELLSSSKDDRALINTVKRISSYISAQAFPYEWLNNMCEAYNPDISIDDSAVKDYVFSEIEYSIKFFIGIADDCLNNIDKGDEVYQKCADALEGDLNVFNSLLDKLDGSWDDMRSALSNVSFAGAVRSGKNYEGFARDYVNRKRALYRTDKAIKLATLLDLMPISAEEFKEDNNKLYPLIKYLCNIVFEYNEKMLEIKKELGAYTFSDIEHFAINLLFTKEDGAFVKTDLAREYESSFYEILVDEYQDTNSAQDTLFEMLSNGKNRFMVGDIKQSIYRFRLAMPDIFNDKKESYDEYSANSDSVNQKVILDKNFRSRDGICSYVNFVFSNLMSKKVGGIDYTDEDYLHSEAKYKEKNAPCVSLKVSAPPYAKEEAVRYEAIQIAKLIESKIKAKEQVKDGDDCYRDIRYSDFAILLRVAKGVINIYTEVLNEFSIPVAANNKSSLFDTNEISILISFLKTIDNPTRDVPLLATLMSVFYGYSADDIASVRINGTNESLYASISRDKAKFGRLIEDIEKFRKYASSMSIESFLRQLIGSTSYLSLISAMGNAEQRRLNVFKFLELAHNFDNGENVGITAFMRYIDAVISSGVSLEGANVISSRENCVTITSVHQSKGLEFPVCIYANTTHQYNDNDLKELILLNYKNGIGFKVNDEKNMARYNSLQYTCLKNINKSDAISESLRLLYVAITRAKEQFISFITFGEAKNRNPIKHIDSLSKQLIGGSIPPLIVRRAGSDSDLLLLTALLHKDAGVLRELCDGEVALDNSADFALDVEFITDVTPPETSEEEIIKPNDELAGKIADKLSFAYQKKELASFSSKRSASDLDERDRGFMFFAKSKPAFLSDTKLTPAQKGTAMHTFMQYCEYENAKNDLESEINRLLNLSYLSEKEADAISREKLGNFFNGAFAKRMFESDKIYREIKVASFVKASDIEDTDYDDEILVQGIADCVFEENGELVLVDYKTDYVKSEEELLNLYKNQIAFYKSAIEKTLEKPVKQALLYSFCLGKECEYK